MHDVDSTNSAVMPFQETARRLPLLAAGIPPRGGFPSAAARPRNRTSEPPGQPAPGPGSRIPTFMTAKADAGEVLIAPEFAFARPTAPPPVGGTDISPASKKLATLFVNASEIPIVLID